MKKLLTYSTLSIISLTLIATPALALTAPEQLSTKRAITPISSNDAAIRLQQKQTEFDQHRQNFASKTADRKIEIASKAAEQKLKLQQKHIQLIKQWMEKVVTRMQKAVDRFGKIITRVESRRDKLKTINSKKDLTRLNTWIIKAKENLTAAQTAVNNAKTAVDTIDANSLDAKTQVTTARDAITAAKKSLITMWTTMKQVVQELKIQSPTPVATPSATNKEATPSAH